MTKSVHYKFLTCRLTIGQLKCILAYHLSLYCMTAFLKALGISCFQNQRTLKVFFNEDFHKSQWRYRSIFQQTVRHLLLQNCFATKKKISINIMLIRTMQSTFKLHIYIITRMKTFIISKAKKSWLDKQTKSVKKQMICVIKYIEL